MKNVLAIVLTLLIVAPAHGDGSSSSMASASPPVGEQPPLSRRFKILLLQGANLSYLGRREPEIYGTTTAAELDSILRTHAEKHRYDIEIFYTHVEGVAIERLYRAVDEGFDGVVMNPGGFTYNGYALRDCLRTLPFPYIEVHITNLDKRGIRSVPAEVAIGVISGFGADTYVMGLDAMLNLLVQKGGSSH
jgi:3-dehydroquinate dehydratase-2